VNEDAAPTHGDGRCEWAAPRRFALLLAVLIVIPFWDILLGLKSFVVRDYGLFSYPVAYYLRESLWHGEWPLWNPYSCCGLPFLAQFNTLALYPPSLFYLLLPLTWALGVFSLLHMFLAGMGMYFLAARWTGSRAGGALAGVVFAFNGLTLNFLMWPSHLAAFAWAPWLILLAEEGWGVGGRKLILAAVVGGLQILAGGPEEILFTWLILLALALGAIGTRPAAWMTVARRFVTIGLLAGGLAAAQELPFADFVLNSNRNTHFADSSWAMPPWGWGNFLVPMFYTGKWQQIFVQRAQFWTTSYYAGIGVVLLAGVAMWRVRKGRVWFLGALLLASVILALGDSGYLYLWARRMLPFLGMFRFPVKFVILTIISMSLLAAYAVAHYESRKPEQRWCLEILAVVVMIALIGFLTWMVWRWPLGNTPWHATAVNGAGCAVFLAFLVATLYFFAVRPAWRGWTLLLLLAICWGDLMIHIPWQNPTVDPSVFQPGLGQMSDKLEPVPAIDESRVMMSPYSARQLYYKVTSEVKGNYVLQRATFLADCNLLDKIPKVDGFFSLSLHYSDRVIWLLEPSTGQQLDSLEDLLSVSHTIAPGKVFDWVLRTNYIPIVTAGQQPVFAADDSVYDTISSGTGDFRNTVYLPPEAKGHINARREPAAHIVAKSFTAMRQKIDVEAPAATMVVVTQAYYHDWTAQVDGKPAPLWRANYAFEAVEVPAGRHEVTLVYQDEAFRVGAVVSVCTLVLCAAAWALMGDRVAKD
jgi:hypothetical protein